MLNACVTGATGMVGRRVVQELLSSGYKVRVLSRKSYKCQLVRVYIGDITNRSIIRNFIEGADAVFHCAAELFDESKMWETNVVGTGLIAEFVEEYKIKYFCHISSAGVVGKTALKIIDESSHCKPFNQYEYTKLESERIIERIVKSCRTVILRPTNVIDAQRLGDLSLPINGSLRSWLKVFIKGGEVSHIVHAKDVAKAALFFLKRGDSNRLEKYFVSIDDDSECTISHLWAICRCLLSTNCHENSLAKPLHLPVFFIYYLRLFLGRPANYGDIKYSSNKILSEGFVYSMNVRKAVEAVLSEKEKDFDV
jgi:nucleoside-diphosphate-sugar epimerase